MKELDIKEQIEELNRLRKVYKDKTMLPMTFSIIEKNKIKASNILKTR